MLRICGDAVYTSTISYRRHQRPAQWGIQVSRSSLTTWINWAIDLLRPIVDAQNQHPLPSRVLAMDETAIKAGRLVKGKMRQAYFSALRWRIRRIKRIIPETGID